MSPREPAPSALDSIPRGLALRRGMSGHCPRCDSAAIYQSRFRLHRNCPNCGLPLEMEDGWSYGSVPLAYILACLGWVLPVGLLYLAGLFSIKTAVYIALAGVVFLPVLTFRFTKSLWVGLYYAILPQEMRHRREDERGDIH